MFAIPWLSFARFPILLKPTPVSPYSFHLLRKKYIIITHLISVSLKSLTNYDKLQKSINSEKERQNKFPTTAP